jgi:hypothetical protein
MWLGLFFNEPAAARRGFAQRLCLLQPHYRSKRRHSRFCHHWIIARRLVDRLQLIAATPAVDVGVNDTFYKAGWYNPLTSAQLAWDLGNNRGFSYLVGAYWDVNSPTAWSLTSLNQRFALSYTGYGWNLTANAIWGIESNQVTSRPQLSPCPVSVQFPSNGCNPNFLNVDLPSLQMRSLGRRDPWQIAPRQFTVFA